jgi:hypothetical protein
MGNVRLLVIFMSVIMTNSSTAGEAGTTLSAFGSWLQALWNHGDSCGPAILFQPVELLTTVQTWSDELHSSLAFANMPLVTFKVLRYSL